MRLIDADELKKKFAYITHIRFTADMGQGGFEMFSEKEIEDIIDNAPTVKTYCYYCGQTEHGRINETTFDDYLKEQLKDPEFRKEWEKLCDEDIQKGEEK